MIKPKCDSCSKELEEFGGLLLSPPDADNLVYKFHLCTACFKKVADFMIYGPPTPMHPRVKEAALKAIEKMRKMFPEGLGRKD